MPSFMRIDFIVTRWRTDEGLRFAIYDLRQPKETANGEGNEDKQIGVNLVPWRLDPPLIIG